MAEIRIVEAREQDVPQILEMIQGLAEYEKLTHACTATEEQLRQTLFGPRPGAEVLLASMDGVCVAFALFFSNYSTFLAKPGMYLEDLFVKPEARGKGVGLALLQKKLAAIARDRNYGRVEWSVLDWNEPAIGFYKKLRRCPHGRVDHVPPHWRRDPRLSHRVAVAHVAAPSGRLPLIASATLDSKEVAPATPAPRIRRRRSNRPVQLKLTRTVPGGTSSRAENVCSPADAYVLGGSS